MRAGHDIADTEGRIPGMSPIPLAAASLVAPDVAEWISVGLSAVLAVAAVCGVWIARQGLKTWKYELRGRAEYDLARRLLLGAYAVRDALWLARTSAFFQYGPVTRPTGDDPDDRARHRRELTEMFYRRLEDVQEAQASLDADLLEAEVLWGEQLKGPSSMLRDCSGKHKFAVAHYVHDAGGCAEKPRLPEKQRQALREIVFCFADKPGEDKHSAAVEAAVNAFKDVLKPRISKPQ